MQQTSIVITVKKAHIKVSPGKIEIGRRITSSALSEEMWKNSLFFLRKLLNLYCELWYVSGIAGLGSTGWMSERKQREQAE